MNVGLTCAKSSLWVLGNSQSLPRDEFWRKLVEDAQKRDRYTQSDLMGMSRQHSTAFPAQFTHPPRAHSCPDGFQGRINNLNDDASTQRQLLNGQYQDLKRAYPGNGDFNKHVEKTTLEVIGLSRQHAANIARLKQRLTVAWNVSLKDLEDAFGQTTSKDFFHAVIKLSALHNFDESLTRLREKRTSWQASKTAGGASRKRVCVPQDAQNALKKAKAETEPEAHPSPSIKGGRGQSADREVPDDFGGDNDFSDDDDYFEDNYGGSGTDDNLDGNLAESLLDDQNEPDVPVPPPKRRRRDSSASFVPGDSSALLTPKMARSPRRGNSAPPSPTPTRNKAKGKAAVLETSEDGAMPINAKACEQLVNGQMLHSSVVDRVVELAVSTRPEWRAINSSSFTNPIPLRHVMRANEKENTLLGPLHQHGHWTLVRCIRDADDQVRKEHWDSIAGGRSNATVDSLLDLNSVDCGIFVAVVCLFLCADQSLPSTLNTRLWQRVLFCLLKDDGDVDGDELQEEESEPGRLSTLSPTEVLALVRDVGERTVAAQLRKEKLDRVAHAILYVEDLHEVKDLA
ncbi:hypothetical protein BC567DRAFT_252919 [Phyllosticta citribraziliensis]